MKMYRLKNNSIAPSFIVIKTMMVLKSLTPNEHNLNDAFKNMMALYELYQMVNDPNYTIYDSSMVLCLQEHQLLLADCTIDPTVKDIVQSAIKLDDKEAPIIENPVIEILGEIGENQ